jgi:hypothetical protein
MTATAERARTPVASSAAARALARLICATPDVLPVAVLSFGIVSVLALLFDAFVLDVVVPLGILTSAAFATALPRLEKTDRHAALTSLCALVLVALWVTLNAHYVSEFVVVTRDPGFLTLEALWLDDNPSPQIPVGTAGAVADSVDGAMAGSVAFTRHGEDLFAQGNKMLPALLAIAGWLGGELAVLAANLALGAIGLLAVFATARRLMGPWWSLTPMVALAVSLPYITFSRAPYTEPLTLAFVFGGIAAATGALRSGRIREYALTGALFGGASAARVDGALTVVALLVALALPAAMAMHAEDRRHAGLRYLAVAVPALALTALGYVDIRLQSPTYLADHADLVEGVLALCAAAALAGGALVVLPGLGGLRRWTIAHRHLVARAALLTTLIAFVFLASRPLWLVSHGIDPDSPVMTSVGALQQSSGLALDPRRSYDELSVSWLSWYYGWHTVALAAVGLGWALYHSIRHGKPAAFLFPTVVGVASLYYLLRVSITPDQIWAMRRLIPVAAPGMLIAAAWAVSQFAGRHASRRGIAALAAGALMAFPIASWDDLITHVEHRGRYSQASALCSALEREGIDHIALIQSSAFRYLPTVRVICDVEVVEFPEPPDRVQLAAVAEEWAGETVGVVSFDPELVPWRTLPGEPVDERTTETMGRRLTERPHTVVSSNATVWAGILGVDGTVVPIAAGDAGDE